MLEALKHVFIHNRSVDFHGSYEVVEPGIAHKQRVQTLTIDIWRATGYRFTCVISPINLHNLGLTSHCSRVKDHPRINNGHKTRFWCSQDEAHRSKSSKLARLPNSTSKPRISSAGEALAKARYPCKSRLLISSRDCSNGISGSQLITVRMHHHVPHEPYVDTSLPPELAQAVYESFGWSNIGGTAIPASATVPSGSSFVSVPPLPPGVIGFPDDGEDMDDDEVDAEAEAEEDEDEDEEIHSVSQPTGTPVEPLQEPASTTPLSAHFHRDRMSIGFGISASASPNFPSNGGDTVVAPNAIISSAGRTNLHLPNLHTPSNNLNMNNVTTPSGSSLHPNQYHQRMRAHITNIREFCNGLEYQLQFDDYRMLDVLEREGGAFLHLVQDCLKKEGRLDPAGSIG